MASPQKENGFTPIANEILERLVNISLLGAEFQILFFIIRKTYGYHKKEDRISLTQFEKGTGLSRPTVVKTLKNLMARNMIVKIYLPDENKGYSFVKDHEKWVVKTHLLVKGKWETSKDVLTKTSKDVLTHKRKKDITKDIPETSSGEIEVLIKSFENINPACKKMYGNKNQRQACKDLINNYTFERTKTVIENTLPKTNTLDYFPIITTPTQLLMKWSTLEASIRKLRSKSLTEESKKGNVIW